tara:strand:- start:2606 stop:2710 length:105 start_codon:yes stop_codon:yes gene_type:complete
MILNAWFEFPVNLGYKVLSDFKKNMTQNTTLLSE